MTGVQAGPADDGREGGGKHVPLWLLTLITFSGTLAMHIFVPALPYAAADLNASIGIVQMTVSVYILGLAVGQLAYGPLADRFGRRPVLKGGLALYMIAGLAAMLAPDIHSLIAARLCQALGGCAGLVLGRAILRDTANPTEAARRLATMNLMVTVGPGVAPIIGGALSSSLGWRSIFLFLFALGVVNLICTYRLIPETAKPLTSQTGSLARNYRQLLVSPQFIAYSIGGGCATTTIYAFIASAPFIFVDQLHRPSYEVGIYLALLLCGAWTGSILTSRLVYRVSIERLASVSSFLALLGACTFLVVILSGHQTVAWTVLCMVPYSVSVGIAAPTTQTLAVNVNPNIIASASGLYGFTQMGLGAGCTALVALGRDPSLASAIILVAAGCIAQVCFWIASRHRRDPAD